MGHGKDEPAALAKYPTELAERSAEILDMLESLTTDDRVKVVVLERKRAIQVGLDQANTRESQSRDSEAWQAKSLIR